MAHALNNASHTSVCAELGITRGNDRTNSSLVRYVSVNKWSFYRPGSIAPDGSDYVQRTIGTDNDKLGDFRGYNHSAVTPSTPSDFTNNWGPGGTTTTMTFSVTVGEMNIREITAGSAPYITVKYYLSATNRSAGTSVQRTYTVAFSETTNTPPTGHTNNQTLRPTSSTQLVQDTAFPTSLLTKPDDIVYCDIYISDNVGAQIARFGTIAADGYVDVTTHEVANPFVDACGPNLSPPSGYTTAFAVVTTTSSAKNGADISRSNGDTTTGTFYWYIAALNGSDFNWYRLGSVSVTALLRIRNPEGGTSQGTTTILSGTLNSAGISSNQLCNNLALSTPSSWDYDDVGDVEVSVSSWTGFTSYSLGSSSPTCT